MCHLSIRVFHQTCKLVKTNKGQARESRIEILRVLTAMHLRYSKYIILEIVTVYSNKKKCAVLIFYYNQALLLRYEVLDN